MTKILSILISTFFFFHIFAQVPKNTRTFETNLAAEYPGYIKHLHENNSEIYYSSFNYNNFDALQVIKKFGSDGLLKWKVSITNAENNDLSLSKHYISVDKDDNIILCFNPASIPSYIFTDANGNSQDLSIDGYKKVILKIDKNGVLVWKRNFSFPTHGHFASVYSDNKGDVYFIRKDYTVENSMSQNHFLISKLDGNTGDILYTKDYEDVGAYTSFALFDSEDNFYVFLDAYTDLQEYNFEGITINRNFAGDNIMLKYDKNGNIILGKNFYSPGNDFDYSILSDGIFDGNDIILHGFLRSSSTGDYKGLDDVFIPHKYFSPLFQLQNQGLLAKIDVSGNVIWQKPIYSNTNINKGIYTNIDVDTEKNIYSYLYFKDKVTYNDIEYQFDADKGNKVISKFDTNGNLMYLNPVDVRRDYTNYYSSTAIDVIKNDVYNCSGVTLESNFLNYPFYNINVPKNYIATFGNLDQKYLTPEKNYLLLTNAEITNNINNNNTFSFNLINNINWTATSDQSWLGVSYTQLAEKKGMNTTISGNGDAQITLTAETNNSGNSRSANIFVSGDNDVTSKTIIITQSATLANNEIKTYTTVLYPNPASDILNIQTELKIFKTEILDLSGKLLKSNTTHKKIEISNLTKGIYIIKIYTDSGIINSKFIKK